MAYDEAGIRAQYPQLAYLLNDPEIGAKLRQAYDEGWPADRFTAEIMGTAWWQRTSDSERIYGLDKNTDPASYRAKLDSQSRTARRIAGNLGYDLDAGYIQYFADKAYRTGLDEEALRSLMVDEITPLIGTTEKSPILQAIRESSQQYGIVLDNNNLGYWLAELGSGRRTIENLNNTMRQQIKDMFPHLSNEFDQGQTFRQIQEPYKAMAVQTLELDPERVDFIGDPKFRQLLQHTDDKGTTRKMSLNEAAVHLRSQTEWRNTKNFQDQSDSAVRKLERVFTGA